jgi:hypothetical protein
MPGEQPVTGIVRAVCRSAEKDTVKHNIGTPAAEIVYFFQRQEDKIYVS